MPYDTDLDSVFSIVTSCVASTLCLLDVDEGYDAKEVIAVGRAQLGTDFLFSQRHCAIQSRRWDFGNLAS